LAFTQRDQRPYPAHRSVGSLNRVNETATTEEDSKRPEAD
jgi:hypothetical protein